ncbi:MAG: NADP-dependent oxidoreductase, partial [Sphingopyxis sp.]|nr:NADP-dependent oxidoreductase [Sphingopyxis sp.]
MNRAWHLSSRPIGLPTLDNFALRALPDGPLDADQLRVRNLWLSVDPYMRGRMN